MTEVQESSSVPVASNTLSQGLKTLVLAIIENHKAAAGNVMAEVSADVTAAVQSLGPALAQAGLLGDELKARPLGAAKALIIAALEAAEHLAGEVK